MDQYGISLPFFEEMRGHPIKIPHLPRRYWQRRNDSGRTRKRSHALDRMDRAVLRALNWRAVLRASNWRCRVAVLCQPYALVSSSFCFHVVDLGEMSVAG